MPYFMRMKTVFALLATLLLLNGVSAQTLEALEHGRRSTALDYDDYLIADLAPFYHGVASGDPLTDRVIIWTRYTPPAGQSGNQPVSWEMATDLAFANIVRNGGYVTNQTRDYTVKIDVDSLQPNTFYYYRFIADGDTSLIGRTKTAPDTITENLKIAAVSCQDWRDGYFNAWGGMAERNDIDLVLHLGDYLYEGGGGGEDRPHAPGSEMYRLEDYRLRYAQYRLDPDLRRAHQVYPFANIIDDHDIVVDAVGDTSLRHNPAFGPYSDRKTAAIQALYEWVPIREDTAFFKLWRHLPYGELLDVFMLDCRVYDRDIFPEDTDDPRYQDTTQRFLGSEQLSWLIDNLANSTARYKLIGSSLQFSQFGVNIPFLGVRPFILENWDGYPHERNKIFDVIDDNGIDNVVWAAGDWHTAYALDVARNPYSGSDYDPASGAGSRCVEFIVPSINAGNFDEGSDFGLGSPAVADGLIRLSNPHFKHINLTDHGFLLLDFDSTRVQGEFYRISSLTDPDDNSITDDAVWFANNTDNFVQQGSDPAPQKSDTAAAPPDAPFLELPSLEDDPVSRAEAPTVVMGYGPNPFVEELWVRLYVQQAGQLTAELYDLNGRKVLSYTANAEAPGAYVLKLAGSDLAAGTYLLKLTQGAQQTAFRVVRE